METASKWAEAAVELVLSPESGFNFPGFADTESALVYLTHPLFVPECRHRKGESLKQTGVPIDTHYQGVELNTRFSMNGRHPFQVITQWQNPETSEVHVFKSNNIWFDPSSYIHTDTITVFCEKDDLSEY